MTDQIHELLNIWFGNQGSADLPTSDRTEFWFGENTDAKKKLIESFHTLYDQAINDALSDWEKTARGRLALIILLDQFSRAMHSKGKEAFMHDEKAQHLAQDGIQQKMDQSLTLIERVFFYMPLVHSENEALQEESIRLFEELVSLSMPETIQVYQLFLAYAYAHFRVIKTFGRFPQRNAVLGRTSTKEEIAFLNKS